MSAATSFVYLTFEQINTATLELKGKYAQVDTAEKMFDVKPANDNNGISCSPMVIHISDFSSLSQDVERPQIFISGEIHGDEKIGPIASLFTAQILVFSAQCEIDKIEDACKTLRELHIEKDQRIWLTYLLTRRDIYIIPTVNCYGYLKNDRGDLKNIDPNRDFSYVRQDNKCFQSPTANIILELFRHTIIQSVVTFHGGTTSIGYEWGSQNHMKPNDKCPDHTAHENVAKVMSNFGGSFGNIENYRVDPINTIIYPVWGGMEDWMYASAWDKKNLQTCSSSIMKSNEEYESDGRALVFLVETSDEKMPSHTTLGKMRNPLENSPSGHIARNARVGLVSVDTVQPYVCLGKRVSIKKRRIFRGKNSLPDDSGSVELKVKWYVGGGLIVDSSSLAWHAPPMSWKDLYEQRADATLLRSVLTVNSNSVPIRDSNTLKGKARWSLRDPMDPNDFSAVLRVKPMLAPLETNISSSTAVFKDGEYHVPVGDHWLVAWATVDQAWGSQDQGEPKGPPQSHVANARANANWRESESENKRSGGRQVRGRVGWPSDPVIVRVSKDGEVSVVSQVEDCAWWTRTYNSREDVFPVSSSSPLRTLPEGVLSPRVNYDHYGTKHHQHSSLFEHLLGWEECKDWAYHFKLSGAGVAIFVGWLAVFGYFLLRCQKKRAYARIKRSDIEAV